MTAVCNAYNKELCGNIISCNYFKICSYVDMNVVISCLSVRKIALCWHLKLQKDQAQSSDLQNHPLN